MISLFTSLVHFFLGKWYLQFVIVFIKDVFQHVFENVHRKGNFFQYKRIQKLNSFEVQPQHQLENSWIKMTFSSYSNKSFMFWLDDHWKNGGVNKRSNDSGTLRDQQRAICLVFIQMKEVLFFFQGLFKITLWWELKKE